MLIGVVGKPNCGKSTFFQSITLSEVEAANYPFATIEPNEGVGFVKVRCADQDFDTTCDPRSGRCIDGERFVPIKMIDVAGLVPGAHEGKGMGLEFLNDLNQADALIHVIDLSGGTNAKGEPVPNGSYDPAEDIKFLETELDQWYLGLLEKNWEKFVRRVTQTDLVAVDELTKQFSGVGASEGIVKDVLRDAELEEKTLDKWSGEDKLRFCSVLREYTKPMIIAGNKADVPGAMENYERLVEEFPDYEIVPMSAESELALKRGDEKGTLNYVPGHSDFSIEADVSDQQRDALGFIEDVLDLLDGTGAQNVVDKAVFDVLDMIYVFPGGSKKLEDKDGNTLPDCFLLPRGSTALDFAYHIHSDLGENFVQAIDVRENLHVKKDHVLQSGDVIEIVADI